MAELLAFTTGQVVQLTGLSRHQLAYWERTGFFAARYPPDPDGRAFTRAYSFRDLVGLRTLALLRREHLVPLQELRKVGSWLAERHEAPWAELRFTVVRRRVVFGDSESGALVLTQPSGQTALPFDFPEVAREMAVAADAMARRSPEQIGRVERRRHVLGGQPHLAGTRITTASIWRLNRAGHAPPAILREYPALSLPDIEAALAQHNRRRAG